MKPLLAVFVILVPAVIAAAPTPDPWLVFSQGPLRLLDRVPSISIPAPQIPAKEAEFLLAQQSRRTLQLALLVAREENRAIEDLVQAASGANARPMTEALVRLAVHDASILGMQAMIRFNTPLPSKTVKGLTSITPIAAPFGYPSGFATNTQVTIRLLELCAKKELPAVRELGRQTLQRRLQGGMEWPTAIIVGQDFGDAVFDALKSSPKFKQRLTLAQGEW